MIQPDELARTLREFAVAVARSTRSAEMSRVAVATLGLLERGGPQRITALAESEAVTQPAMTGLVQRLEAAGHVRREPDPDDGRASLISITGTGREALAARRADQDARIADWLATLSPDARAALAAAAPALHTYPGTSSSEPHAHH